MSDPKWDAIYRDTMRADLPSAPRLSVPLVRNPSCEAHCSGRHHTEATIKCPRCGTDAYRVVAHEWVHSEAHYFYTTEPMNGAPPGLTTCPSCRHGLKRS